MYCSLTTCKFHATNISHIAALRHRCSMITYTDTYPYTHMYMYAFEKFNSHSTENAIRAD